MRKFPFPVFISAPAFPQRVPCFLQALTNHLALHAGNPVLTRIPGSKRALFFVEFYYVYNARIAEHRVR